MTTVVEFKECVATTNGIIQRWLTQNNVNPSKIYVDDVRGILLGYMQKMFKGINKADFKRFSRCITVIINERTKMISHVLFGANSDLYFRDKGFIESLAKIIDTTDYPSIEPKKSDVGNSNDNYLKDHYYDDKPNNKIELSHLNTNVDINFKSIESIKF